MIEAWHLFMTDADFFLIASWMIVLAVFLIAFLAAALRATARHRCADHETRNTLKRTMKP